MRKTKAFTLIELIVVLAIIALLMSVLLPGLSRARQQARTAICATQLKQLYFGFNDYSLEYKILPWGHDKISCPDGLSPVARRINSHYDELGWWWFDYLAEFMGDSMQIAPLLRCPSRNITESDYTNNLVWGNYGVNQSLCTRCGFIQGRSEFTLRQPMRWPMSNPAATMLVMDSGYAVINWWHATVSPPGQFYEDRLEDKTYIPGLRVVNEIKLKLLYSSLVNDAINGRHNNGRVNVCFADGHVECLTAEDLEVVKQGEQYQKRTPFWSPDR